MTKQTLAMLVAALLGGVVGAAVQDLRHPQLPPPPGRVERVECDSPNSERTEVGPDFTLLDGGYCRNVFPADARLRREWTNAFEWPWVECVKRAKP